jgi:hypothetical protein
MRSSSLNRTASPLRGHALIFDLNRGGAFLKPFGAHDTTWIARTAANHQMLLPHRWRPFYTHKVLGTDTYTLVLET